MEQPLRVLIVEDSEGDAQLMLRAVRQAGFEPVAEHVATEAALVTALETSEWDIVLSDFSMPGFNALGAVLLVRQFDPAMPFLLVSGAVGEDIAASMMKSGVDDFVLKSNLSRLGAAVQRGLREGETRRAWRRAERELRDTAARFRSLIENVNDIVLILDLNATVRYQSPSVQRVLGYRPDEFAGRCLLDYIHPDDVGRFRAALNRRKHQPRPDTPPECRIRHVDDSWRVFEGVVTNLVDDPAVRGVVVNIRDVTERKRAEAEALRTQRIESLGSLAGGIAHDLNNLLTPILVAAEMLEQDVSPADRKTLLDGLTISAGRATDLVRHLLSFARGVDEGRKTVPSAELIRDLERLLLLSLSKSVRQRYVVSDDAWPVCGDPTQLLQVLMNLCVNARDAMPSGGTLTVRVENVVLQRQDVRAHPGAEPGPHVLFTIEDTGVGIPPRVQARMFEPFFTTKSDERGTGLGLSTSLSIVRGHHGMLKAYSEPGRGTRFSVHLPAAVTEDRLAAERRVQRLPRGSGEWVLVVDDEQTVREIIRETLETYGYHVLTAANGAEAVALYAEQDAGISLAIVDVSMPLLDGPATVRELRRADPGLRFLIQGGFVNDNRDEFPGDVEDFLEKPFTVERLLNAVAKALRREAFASSRSS